MVFVSDYISDMRDNVKETFYKKAIIAYRVARSSFPFEVARMRSISKAGHNAEAADLIAGMSRDD